MSLLRILPPNFVPRLVIFDKDGTLIDFNYMWASWLTGLARRLQSASGLDISTELYASFGFDPVSARVLPDRPLAVWSMAQLHELAVGVLCESGLMHEAAARAVEQGWYLPDPVALARPLANLPHLFGSLHAHGCKTAVATSDDRAATEATLLGLGLARLVDACVCVDDGLPNKPAPDMIRYVCQSLDIAPAQAVMVGDSVVDLEMGRAAGVGLRVGVLSGLGSRERLEPHADLLIASVGDLI